MIFSRKILAQKRITTLVLLLALASFSLIFSHKYFLEDSFITMHYANRLVEGKGLTWNDGERIEGFTSILWLIQNACFRFFHIDLEWSSKFLGLLYYFGMLGILLWMKTPTILLLPTATLPSLTMYAMSGMVTVSFCFFILAGTVFLYRFTEGIDREGRKRERDIHPFSGKAIFILSGVFFAAAGLTRPEGILAGVAVSAWLFFRYGRKPVHMFLVGFAPPILAYLV